MEEKRRTSARLRRESFRLRQETPPKKKTKRVSAPSTREKEATPRHESPIQEDHLPISVADNKPLPTTRNPELLDREQLKSVAASGVLAASLQRSRTKWLTGGLFEKYWEKPKKKRDYKEPANNPSKDTMKSLGVCRIIIEPHIFETHLFAVKDPQGSQASVANAQGPQASVAKPSTTPFVQYHAPPAIPSPSANSPHPAPSYGAPQVPPQPQVTHTTSLPHHPGSPPATTPGPAQTFAASSRPNSVNEMPAPSPVAPNVAATLPSPATTMTSAPGATLVNPTAPAASAVSPSASVHAQPSAPAKPTQDPVIQMLAQRASTSPELKVLMKIVASGHASKEQLKIFQSHIDDLQAILHRQNQARRATAYASTAQSPIVAPPPAHGVNPYPPASHAVHYSPSPHATFQSHGHMSPAPLKSKMYTPKPDNTPSVIVMEFAAHGDRYHFPRYSILEYVPTLHQIIASFLVTRKGSAAEGYHYNKKLEYYEPVTMRIYSEQHKVLDALMRSVAPSAEVAQYMADSMAKMTRARVTHLALQLPRPSDETEAADEDNANDAAGAPLFKVPRKYKNQEDWDLRCQFCYKAFPSATTHTSADGEIRICSSCAALRRTAALASENRSIRTTIGTTIQRSPAQSILLGPEVS